MSEYRHPYIYNPDSFDNYNQFNGLNFNNINTDEIIINQDQDQDIDIGIDINTYTDTVGINYTSTDTTTVTTTEQNNKINTAKSINIDENTKTINNSINKFFKRKDIIPNNNNSVFISNNNNVFDKMSNNSVYQS
jgi:hypothetical protein